jgi:hypothetical protein
MMRSQIRNRDSENGSIAYIAEDLLEIIAICLQVMQKEKTILNIRKINC